MGSARITAVASLPFARCTPTGAGSSSLPVARCEQTAATARSHVAISLAVVTALAGCGRISFDPLANPIVSGGAHSVLHVPSRASRLHDFPLMVRLDATRADMTILGDGLSARFFDSDGNLLASELEADGPLTYWVRVDLDGDTDITVSYGDPNAPISPDRVFGPDYEAVWHLASTAGSEGDATGNAHTGVVQGATSVPGLAGRAREFLDDGSTWMTVPDDPGFTFTQLTFSGWMFAKAIAVDQYRSMLSRQLGTAGDDDLYLGTQDEMAVGGVSTDVMGGQYLFDENVSLNTWHRITASANPATNTFTVYLDATVAASSTIAGTISHAPRPLWIGAGCNSTQCPDVDFVRGTLDELRIERVARDQAWVSADVATMNDALIDYGPVIHD